jgi:transcriptional regulator with XRE-family HTH domain
MPFTYIRTNTFFDEEMTMDTEDTETRAPGGLKKTAVVPPALLHAQLNWIRVERRLTYDDLASMTGVSENAIDDALHGNGKFSVFCKLSVALSLKMDFRSWDYQRIVPLENSTDPVCICSALTEHGERLPYFPWGRITQRDETSMYWCEPSLRLRAVAKYLRYIGVTARLVSA